MSLTQKKILYFFENLKNVSYCNLFPKIGKDNNFEKVITTKSLEWSHEKEWRVIRNDLYGIFSPVNPQAITSVIFGCSSANWEYNNNEECVYEQIFKNLQRPEYNHVKLKCMMPDQEEYRLKCLEMPFFVIQKSSHSFSIISTQEKQTLIITYDGGKRLTEIYRAPVCKWKTTEITLPKGFYFVENDKSKCNIRIQVKDDK